MNAKVESTKSPLRTSAISMLFDNSPRKRQRLEELGKSGSFHSFSCLQNAKNDGNSKEYWCLGSSKPFEFFCLNQCSDAILIVESGVPTYANRNFLQSLEISPFMISACNGGGREREGNSMITKDLKPFDFMFNSGEAKKFLKMINRSVERGEPLVGKFQADVLSTLLVKRFSVKIEVFSYGDSQAFCKLKSAELLSSISSHNRGVSPFESASGRSSPFEEVDSERATFAPRVFESAQINEEEIQQSFEWDPIEVENELRFAAILREFFDTAPVIMAVVEVLDETSVVAHFGNKLFETYFGAHSNVVDSENMGVSLEEFEGFIEVWRNAQSLGKPMRYQATRKFEKMGAVLTMDFIVIHVKDNVFALSAHDVTEMKKLEDELASNKRDLDELVKARTAQLEAALATKTRFLAIMSHEIRTPLSGILGMVSLLSSSNELSPDCLEMARTAQICSEQLMTLISDILDFAKTESNSMRLECSSFSPLSVLEDSLDVVGFSAEKKAIEVVSDYDDGFQGLYVLGDSLRLRQILVNLLSNAVKFSSDNSEILARVKMERKGDKMQMKFSVEDFGVGIPEKSKSSIFQPFNQADTSITRKYGGTGLGLTICKQLSKLMGGEIWFDSEEGKGSVFHFTVSLPQDLTKIPAPSDSARNLTPNSSNSLPKRVEIFLPSERMTSSLANKLKIIGIPHVNSHTRIQQLEEPLKKLHASDVVLTDSKLMEEVLRQMSSTGARARVLVLGTVSTQLPRTISITVVKKPVRSSSLFSALNKRNSLRSTDGSLSIELRRKSIEEGRVKRSRSIGNGSPPTIDSPSSGEESPTPSIRRSVHNIGHVKLSHEHKRILVVEDNLMNQKVLRRLLSRFGYNGEVVVDNGKKAVEAVQQEQFDLILMDVMMPVMSGLEATMEIRRLIPKDKQPKIFALTANTFEEDLKQCISSGMDGVLTKPINLSALKEVIASVPVIH